MTPNRINWRCGMVACGIGVGLACGSAAGGQQTVQIDSWTALQPAFIVGDFVPGERAGVRLTSPCDGAIVAVQVGWTTADGSTDVSVERAIRIYDGSTFPTPGPLLTSLVNPQLTAPAINQFQLPAGLPVSEGQRFLVALEFDNPTDVAGGSGSVYRDFSGCTASSNALFAIPGGWLNFCLFISGDLVIRAVVDCQDCAADLNGDGVVDGIDLGQLLANWSIPAGAPGCVGVSPCAADINGDGVVDGIDLGIVLANWSIPPGSPGCPP